MSIPGSLWFENFSGSGRVLSHVRLAYFYLILDRGVANSAGPGAGGAAAVIPAAALSAHPAAAGPVHPGHGDLATRLGTHPGGDTADSQTYFVRDSAAGVQQFSRPA